MVVVRVIFGEESDSRRLTLNSGFPETVEELRAIIKTYFKVSDDFRLQFMDPMFKEFMNLESITDIEDMDTLSLKIIYIPALHPVHVTPETLNTSHPPPAETSTTYLQLGENSTTTYLPPAETSTALHNAHLTLHTVDSNQDSGLDLTLPATFMPTTGAFPANYMPTTGTSPAPYRPFAQTLPAPYMPLAQTLPAPYTPLAQTSPANFTPLARTLPATYTPLAHTSHANYMSTAGTSSTTYVTPAQSPPSPAPSSAFSSSSGDAFHTSNPLSSPESTVSGSTWPKVFVIPKFTYDAEYQLKQKNAEFELNGTYFTPGLKLKGAILEGLAQEIMKYTKYPKDYQWEQIAEALIRAHPCLAQLGATDGFGGWKQSLKIKMQNYRTKLGRLGHPEILVNSFKHKREGKGKPAAKIKKPKKAEVNYIPLPPKGKTPESLEEERIALLSEVKKRDNEVVIRAKMGMTFSHRRLELVDQRPFVGDFMDRWPALFQQSEINAEFMRITTKPLQSSFMAQLDHYSNKLIRIFESKGGQNGKKIKDILVGIDSCDINTRRERVLKSLVLYLGERADMLFKEFKDSAALETLRQDPENKDPVWLYTAGGRADGTKDIGIVIEKVKVMENLDSLILGFVMMFGLIYALDLKYPAKFQNTFDFIQKVVLGLDPHTPKKKVELLKIKLFE